MANPNPSPSTRFQKGRSGNPGGRRSGGSLTALVRAQLDKPVVEGSPITKREMLAGMIVDRAIAGDDAMIKSVWAYEDGTPISKQEHGEPGDFDLLLDRAREVLRVDGKRAG